MYRDIPDKLLLQTKRDWAHKGRELQEQAMAEGIIFCVFGPDWYGKNFHTKDANYINTNDRGEYDTLEIRAKTIRLAHYLYLLKDSEGFNQFTDALVTKDFKSCNWELAVAARFKEEGFTIKFIQESGEKGKDFDFLVTRNEIQYQVEAKSRDKIDSDINSIKNVLKDARKQLPKGGNGVLYISVPEHLMANETSSNEIDLEILSFLRSTNRVSFVMIAFDAKKLIRHNTKAIIAALKQYNVKGELLISNFNKTDVWKPCFWNIEDRIYPNRKKQITILILLLLAILIIISYFIEP